MSMKTTMMSSDLQHKLKIQALFQEINASGAKGLQTALDNHFAKAATVEVTSPFESMQGMCAFKQGFWDPLFHSFPNLEIQPYILVGGRFEGRSYVSCTGNFIGTFKEDWLEIPATGQATWLRFAGHFLLEGDRVAKAWFFFDMLDILRQAGFTFFPGRAVEHVPPGPMTGDGVVTYETDPKEGEKTLDLTNAMLNGLGSYDGSTLESMGQQRFWDEKNMMWYGPSGIGTTRGLKGFQKYHQVPFITAFPDRGITPKKDEDYFAQIGDGMYSCDFGFPAMYGTHLNDGWLGLAATGKKITLRVVDYWRRDGDKLRENWVFIDMIHVLEQFGVDVFGLLKEELENKQKHLNGIT